MHNVQNLVNIVRRRLLEQSSNLIATSASGGSPPLEIVSLPTTRSSGSYPAVQKEKEGQLHPSTPSTGDSVTQPNPKTANPDSQSSGSVNKPAEEKPSLGGISGYAWKHIGMISGGVLLFIAATMFIMCRRRAASTIGPWKTGLSGQLQKAFVTGNFSLSSEALTLLEITVSVPDTWAKRDTPGTRMGHATRRVH